MMRDGRRRLGGPCPLPGLPQHALAGLLGKVLTVVLRHQYLNAVNELLRGSRCVRKNEVLFDEVDLKIEIVEGDAVAEVECMENPFCAARPMLCPVIPANKATSIGLGSLPSPQWARPYRLCTAQRNCPDLSPDVQGRQPSRRPAARVPLQVAGPRLELSGYPANSAPSDPSAACPGQHLTQTTQQAVSRWVFR